jgi:uncharacterized membrane protein YheB (UPF0754 family)
MEIKIEVSEEEIKEAKQLWIEKQLNQYLGIEYWKRQSTENDLMAEIRKSHQYGAEMYLTPEFKKELQEKYREQVKKLVDEELKRLNYEIKKVVQQYLFEKLDNLVEETLKDAIFTTQTDYNAQFENEENA